MTRALLLLAHEALSRLTCAVARAAKVQALGRLRLIRGRWFVADVDRGLVVWPDGWGARPWVGDHSEVAHDIDRGPVLTVMTEHDYDGCGAIVVTLTRDEVTGDGAEMLRRQRAEDEARWWREIGGET